MAEKLELLVSAKNTADAALKDARTDVRNLERAVRKASDELRRSLDRARRDAKEFAAASKDAATEIDRLGEKSKSTGRAFHHFQREAKSAGGNVTKSTGKMGAGFAFMGSKAMMAGAAVAAVGVAAAAAARGISVLNTAVGALEQSQIKTRTVFRGSNKEMTKWARSQRRNFGSSKQDVLNYAASVQDLLVPMKFSRDEATGMTKDLAGLVPALTQWDKQGRSAGEITDILTAAIMGEREALKGLGIGISQDAVDKQVDLMRSQGKLTGKTDEQADAMATLALIYAKSGDAQKSYARNSDTVARRTQALKSDIYELRDKGLKVMLGLWHRVFRAGDATGFGNGIKVFGKWLKQNSNAIQGYILGFGSVFLRVGGTALKAGAVMVRVFGGVVTAIAKVLEWAALLDPRLQGVADKAKTFSEGIFDLADAQTKAADGMWELADQFSAQATQAGRAQERAELLRQTLKGIKSKTVKITLDTVVQGFQGLGIGAPVDSPTTDTSGSPRKRRKQKRTGDTASPRARGMSSGLLGLAHASYTGGLAGQRTITSGLRTHNLGSPGSDHATGRAMDIAGPNLPAYAGRVRAAGGYAAFHGSGPERHLHAAPGGGQQLIVNRTTNVTVNNPASTVDVQAALRRNERETLRDIAERGGRGWTP